MKNLLHSLLSKLGPVSAVRRSDTKQKWQEVFQKDVIWICIPRNAFPEVLKNVKLGSHQLVIDICSIKRNLSSVIQKTGARHLSLHPLHGPYVPLQGQKWVVIKTHDAANTHPYEKEILHFLKDQGIRLLTADSEEEHDFMIGIVLCMSELLTIVIDSCIGQYAKDCGQKVPDMKTIMEWAVPASNALFSSYIHSINSSADWLREDLVLGAHGNLLESAKKAFHMDLGGITKEDIKKRIVLQRNFVENLPLEERKRVKQWIERWFVDSTQKIFSFHRKKQMKPKILVQHCSNINEVFPSRAGRVSVGVHGIAGCFTHESIVRLCEELHIDLGTLNLKYLVEAERVMQAVDVGEIDRGVFALANSGSGAYVSSVFAMGKYHFDILAVYGMEVLQCLISHTSVDDISHITDVFGHPQAVSQCKRTFAEKYPQIKLVEGKDGDDTALCVKKIAEGEFPKTTATLASQVAASIYGAKILEYGMHHDPFNTTTFLVIKKRML